MRLLKITIIVGALVGLTACSNDTATRRVLADSGYTAITTTGYSFLGCGDDDTYSTGFEAIGPTGRKVTGVVCGGWFKSYTVRLK